MTPRLYGGATVGMEIGCEVEFEGPDVSETADCEETLDAAVAIVDPAFTETKSLDLGLVLGAGLDLGRGPGRLSIDLRYNLGLTNINDLTPQAGESEIQIKNRVLQVLVGYSIGI